MRAATVAAILAFCANYVQSVPLPGANPGSPYEDIQHKREAGGVYINGQEFTSPEQLRGSLVNRPQRKREADAVYSLNSPKSLEQLRADLTIRPQRREARILSPEDSLRADLTTAFRPQKREAGAGLSEDFLRVDLTTAFRPREREAGNPLSKDTLHQDLTTAFGPQKRAVELHLGGLLHNLLAKREAEAEAEGEAEAEDEDI